MVHEFLVEPNFQHVIGFDFNSASGSNFISLFNDVTCHRIIFYDLLLIFYPIRECQDYVKKYKKKNYRITY